MPINALDLFDEFRSRLRDTSGHGATTTGDFVYPWQENDIGLGHSNIEMVRYFHAAMTDMSKRVPFQDWMTIDITAGLREYQFDSRITVINEITLASTDAPLLPLSVHDAKKLDQGRRYRHGWAGEYNTSLIPAYARTGFTDWRAEAATPRQYILDEKSFRVALYPVPLVDDTITLYCERRYIDEINWTAVSPGFSTGVAAAADVELGDLPDEMREGCIQYMLSRAYTKRGQATYDEKLSAQHKQEYLAELAEWEKIQNRRHSHQIDFSVTPWNYGGQGVRRWRNNYYSKDRDGHW